MLRESGTGIGTVSPFMEEWMQIKEVLLVAVLFIGHIFTQENMSKRLL